MEEYKPGDLSKILAGEKVSAAPAFVEPSDDEAESHGSIADEKDIDDAVSISTSVRPDKNRKRKFQHNESEERLQRTLFVGNVPLVKKAAQILENLLGKYVKKDTIESVRLRSVPIKKSKIAAGESFKKMRKVSIIQGNFKKNLDEKNVIATCNAYVVFSKAEEMESSLEILKKTEVVMENYHLRFDAASSSQKDREFDRKKSVFVGQLPFYVSEKQVEDFFNDAIKKLGANSTGDSVVEEKKSKKENFDDTEDCFAPASKKPAKSPLKAKNSKSGSFEIPSDGKIVKSVKIIRDKITNKGKGFGYVLFTTRALVKAGLVLNNSEFCKRKIVVKKCAKPEEREKLNPEKNKRSFEGKRATGPVKFKRPIKNQSAQKKGKQRRPGAGRPTKGKK